MAGMNEMKFLLDNDKSETSILIWLDACVNTSKDNIEAQEELTSILNKFKTFEDLNDCQKYIQSVSLNDRIVLIVSGQLGRQLIPKIHQLEQLSSIYIYCMNKEANEKWSKDFEKV